MIDRFKRANRDFAVIGNGHRGAVAARQLPAHDVVAAGLSLPHKTVGREEAADLGRRQLAEFTATSDRFALVLSDLTMPGMNGLQLAALVRAQRPGVPLVLVSGYWGEADHAEARRIGVTATLHKPLTYASSSAARWPRSWHGAPAKGGNRGAARFPLAEGCGGRI